MGGKTSLNEAYMELASKINQYLIVLGLQELTSHQGSAEKLIEISQKAMDAMELGDGQNFIALTMDNPTVMQSFWNQFYFKFTWILICHLVMLHKYDH